MKRVVCLVLALVMVLSIVPMAGAADAGDTAMTGEQLSKCFFTAAWKNGSGDWVFDPSFQIQSANDNVTFKLYPFSFDASDEDYKLLDPSTLSFEGGSSNISFGNAVKDGSMCYCPVTITGTYNGPVSFEVKTTDGYTISSNCMVRVYLSGQNPNIPSGPSDPSVDVALYTKRELNENSMVSGGRINLLELDNNRVWLMGADGLTMDQIDGINIVASSTVGDFDVAREDKKPTVTPMLRDGSSNRYDLAIDLALPDAGGAVTGAYNLVFSGNFNRSWRVAIESECKQLNFTNENIDYAAGFVFDRHDSDIFSIIENGNTSVCTSSAAAHPENPYIDYSIFELDAGSVTADEKGITVYQKADNISVTVNKVWVETLLGDKDAFRVGVGDDTPTETLENVGSSFKLYVKDGYAAYGRLWADITVEITNGDKFVFQHGTAAVIIAAEQRAEFEFNYEADIAKEEFKTKEIDTITEYLSYIAEEYIDEVTYPVRKYKVVLGPKTYNENIIVDRRFSDNDELHLTGTSANGAGSTIVGGLNLNDLYAGSVSNIDFCADTANDDGFAKGIYHGRIEIRECSFYNYDVAIESIGSVVPYVANSIFVNNDVAWDIDIDRQLWSPDNEHNSFVNNGIAVKMECDHSGNSAYYFRITESNFINNGKDFVVDTGSGVYMYRNYFGELKKNKGNEILPGKYAEGKHNSLNELRLDEMAACKNAQIDQYVQRRAAVIEVAGSSTRVVANPRWKYPIKDWWKINNKLAYDKIKAFSISDELSGSNSDSVEYENILVVDWANDTTIITEESGTLIISAEAFADEEFAVEGDKTIDVVDENENALGTWIF